MNFSFSSDQVEVQRLAEKFAREDLEKTAPILDANQDPAHCRNLFLTNLRKMAELGFIGLNVDEEYGGTRMGVIAYSLAITEIAKACASTALTMSVSNLVAEVIQSIGTEEQKLKYIPRLCSGDYPAGAFCLSEQGAGSDPSSMRTTATKVDGGFLLNGTKMWVTSGEYAGIYVVWAVTDRLAHRAKGISCFLVEAGTSGMEIHPAERKMGQTASSTNSIGFVDCFVSESALLGELNAGFPVATTELSGGRIGIGSLALGLGLAAMDAATLYVTQRRQFGKAIAEMQGPQWMIADHYTDLEAARLLLLAAAFKKEQGERFAKEASMAKLFATESANRACYAALQLFGGMGYTKELPLERYTRDARVTSIYEGSSEIQRTIIAREVLGRIGA